MFRDNNFIPELLKKHYRLDACIALIEFCKLIGKEAYLSLYVLSYNSL